MIILNKNVLTIAGSDCSGGAGIQADLKTITVHKNYGMSVITALTAQNTVGVQGVENISADFVCKQIDSVFTDILPDAVKIGMLSSPEIISAVAEKLDYYNAKLIVLDPVMVSTSGNRLMDERAVETLINQLLPQATVVTPNIPEAEVLANIRISNEEDMIIAAEKIASLSDGLAVLVKGGHLTESSNDLLYQDGNITWFNHVRINNENTHGTGCTLSSAIASNLADGLSLTESIKKAKEYITGAIKQDFDLGNGSGPLNHYYCI